MTPWSRQEGVGGKAHDQIKVPYCHTQKMSKISTGASTVLAKILSCVLPQRRLDWLYQIRMSAKQRCCLNRIPRRFVKKVPKRTQKTAFLWGHYVDSCGWYTQLFLILCSIFHVYKLVQNSPDVATWAIHDVGEWLRSVNLETYAASFRINEISGQVLLDIGLDDLDYMGVTILAHRKLILKGIEDLRKNKRVTIQVRQSENVAVREVMSWCCRNDY